MTKNQIIQTLLIEQRLAKEIKLKTILSQEPRAFEDKVSLDTGFYIQGTNRSGKTHYATIFLRDWLCREYPNGFEVWNYKNLPSFVKMNVLERYIKNYNSFNEDEKYGAKLALEEIKHAKLLIIDDFWVSEGTENFKGLVRESLFNILDWRADNELQTIITTNLDLEKIGEIDENYTRLSFRIRGICNKLILPKNYNQTPAFKGIASILNGISPQTELKPQIIL
jgi:DNA replication protein DnaC